MGRPIQMKLEIVFFREFDLMKTAFRRKLCHVYMMHQVSNTENEDNRRAECLIPNQFAICMRILSPYLPLVWIRAHDGLEMLSWRWMLLCLEQNFGSCDGKARGKFGGIDFTVMFGENFMTESKFSLYEYVDCNMWKPNSVYIDGFKFPGYIFGFRYPMPCN